MYKAEVKFYFIYVKIIIFHYMLASKQPNNGILIYIFLLP